MYALSMLTNSQKMIKTDRNMSELWQIVSKYNVTLVHLVVCGVNSKVYIYLFSVDEVSNTASDSRMQGKERLPYG